MKKTPVPANTGSGVLNYRQSGSILQLLSILIPVFEILPSAAQAWIRSAHVPALLAYISDTRAPTAPSYKPNQDNTFPVQTAIRWKSFFLSGFRSALCKTPESVQIMISQAILLIIFECRPKKQLLHLNVFKFVDKALVDGSSFSHVLK